LQGIKLPHFMLLSFYLFVILSVVMVVVSLMSREKKVYAIPEPVREPISKQVVVLWTLLAAVMIGLYIFFN
ncbi:MAG: Na+/glucose cotransporter, partial [Prevotella sp.]|nr:Na+/glucose cotransporter [Prevotella sp.]